MIEEGYIEELMRFLERKRKKFEILAELADREGNNKDFWWNAGVACGLEAIVSKLVEDTGIGRTYGRENVRIDGADTKADGEEGAGVPDGEEAAHEGATQG